jgi:hypothetical protein
MAGWFLKAMLSAGSHMLAARKTTGAKTRVRNAALMKTAWPKRFRSGLRKKYTASRQRSRLNKSLTGAKANKMSVSSVMHTASHKKAVLCPGPRAFGQIVAVPAAETDPADPVAIPDQVVDRCGFAELAAGFDG